MLGRDPTEIKPFPLLHTPTEIKPFPLRLNLSHCSKAPISLRSLKHNAFLWILSSFFLHFTHNFLAAGFLSPHLFLMWLTGECSFEEILPSRTLFLCLIGFYHILPPDQHVRSSPTYLPIVSTQQPKPTLSLATLNDLPGRKLFPPTPLGLHLNQAVVSSQHIGAEMQLFRTFCYFTSNSASPFWALACSLRGLSWSTPVCCVCAHSCN